MSPFTWNHAIQARHNRTGLFGLSSLSGLSGGLAGSDYMTD